MTTHPRRNETDLITGLPKWPYRDRRVLEKQWLDALERLGIGAFADGHLADPPDELLEGIDQFNNGDFWDCHEILEDVWRDTPYPFRLFYHAIIKTSVGFHHLSRQNRNGARVKLRDGVRLLRIFQPDWLGLRTDRLLSATSVWLPLLEPTAIDWAALDGRPTPHIEMTGGQVTSA